MSEMQHPRMGFQHPMCRFNDVLVPVKSEKSLLRNTFRLGRVFHTEIESGELPFVNETQAFDEINDMSGEGILDVVKSGLRVARDVAIGSVKEVVKQKFPATFIAAKAAGTLGKLVSGPVGTKISNVLSEKFNANPAWRPGFSGERHLLLPTKFGITRTNWMGPKTAVLERIKRGDVGVDGPNGIDEAAKLHDLLYHFARTPSDIRRADKRLISDIRKSSQGPKVKAAAIAMLKGKLLGEAVGVFGPETFTKLPGLQGSGFFPKPISAALGRRFLGTTAGRGNRFIKGDVRPSDTGIVGLDNNLQGEVAGGPLLRGGQIGGPPIVAMDNQFSVNSAGTSHVTGNNMKGTGRDQNMNFRNPSEFVKTMGSAELHDNFLMPYDGELHQFGRQTGRGSPNVLSSFDPAGGGIRKDALALGREILSELPALPSARLKKDLLKLVRTTGRAVPRIVGSKKFKKLQRDILGRGVQRRRAPRRRNQKAGQFGFLASLGASIIIPQVIKLIRGKGQSGGRVDPKKLREVLKHLVGHPRRPQQPRNQKAGQLPFLASLAASAILPSVIKLIRGKGLHTAGGQKGKGGFGTLFSILGPAVASLVIPQVIKGIKKIT